MSEWGHGFTFRAVQRTSLWGRDRDHTPPKMTVRQGSAPTVRHRRGEGPLLALLRQLEMGSGRPFSTTERPFGASQRVARQDSNLQPSGYEQLVKSCRNPLAAWMAGTGAQTETAWLAQRSRASLRSAMNSCRW